MGIFAVLNSLGGLNNKLGSGDDVSQMALLNNTFHPFEQIRQSYSDMSSYGDTKWLSTVNLSSADSPSLLDC